MKNRYKVLQLHTAAKKISGCAATYLPLATCEGNGCPFARGGGCYAEWSRVHLHLSRVVACLGGDNPWRTEAAEISAAAENDDVRGLPIRLRIAGDSQGVSDALETDDSCRAWREVGKGGPAWGYTHAWRKIPAETWKHTAMLASVETARDARHAVQAGYRPALVSLDAKASQAELKKVGLRGVQCHGETRGKLCRDCKLCWKADPSLPVMIFTVHGSACGLRRAIATIKRLNEVSL